MLRRALAGLLLIGAAVLPLQVGAATAEPPAAGSIGFDVHYGERGFKVGEALHQWHIGETRYELRLNLEASGLAGLFGLQYEQRSTGTIDRHGLRPERFSVEQRGRKPESAHFDWSGERVSIRRGDTERHSGEIRPGDQDLLSLWHQARRVARSGKSATVAVATGKSLKQATLEVLGEEVLDLPIGRVATVRMRAYAADGGLDIGIWLSLAHGLLPVRIRIEDEKGAVLDQRAARIELGPAGEATRANTNSNKN